MRSVTFGVGMARSVRSWRYSTVNAGPPRVRALPSTERQRQNRRRLAPMLKLLQTPGWFSPAQQHDLPDTLPGWLVALLAYQADWISRDRLTTVLWPDAGAAEALNNLRANLHRAK